MNYEQLRSVAGNGDVVFVKNGTTPWAHLISWWTGSPYSHVMFAFWHSDRLLIAESSPHGGNRIISASAYSRREFDIIAAPQPWLQIEERALDRAGNGMYGWLSALYIGLRSKLRVKTGLRLPQWHNHAVVCSEYVAEVLDLPDTDITPGELYNYLVNDISLGR